MRKMLLFQMNVILLTLALAKCAEPPKSKEAGEERPKRQLVDAFYSNPKFLSVFQNGNPDDTLTNKFLGSDNRAEYTIDNGEYTIRIYMQQAPVDDEDYAEIQGAYVEADDDDNVSNHAPNYEDAISIDAASPEDEKTVKETVKVTEGEDLPNEVDLQFITSKPSISTPKPEVTPQVIGENQKLVDETVPARNNNTPPYTHVDITGVANPKDSTPATEYLSVIKSAENMNLSKHAVHVGDIVTNNIAANVANNTLYVSQVLQNSTKPVPVPNPPAVKATFDIAEIDHRILVPPPRAQAEIRNSTVINRPKVAKKESKPASSPTGPNGQNFLDKLVNYYLLNTFYNSDQRRTNSMPVWMSEDIYGALAKPVVGSSPNRLLMPRNGAPRVRDEPKITDRKIRPRSLPRY